MEAMRQSQSEEGSEEASTSSHELDETQDEPKTETDPGTGFYDLFIFSLDLLGNNIMNWFGILYDS
jgi:hypothetical protein